VKIVKEQARKQYVITVAGGIMWESCGIGSFQGKENQAFSIWLFESRFVTKVTAINNYNGNREIIDYDILYTII